MRVAWVDAGDDRHRLVAGEMDESVELRLQPVDPRIGRMLLEASQRSCLREVLVIASALSVQDPRERPMEAQQAADQARGFLDIAQRRQRLGGMLNYYYRNAA